MTQPASASTEKQMTDRYLLGTVFQFLKPFWKQLIVVFVLLVGVTILTLLPPYLIQRAVDGPIKTGNTTDLIPIGVVYFLTIAGTFILRFSHTMLLQTVGQYALGNLLQHLFEHILTQDMRFFNVTPVGLIVSRTSNDIDALTELLSTSIVLVLSSLVTLFGIIAAMFLLNWRLALISLAVMPVMIGATTFFRDRIRDAAARLHKIVGEYQAFLNEQFGGMLVVQLFGRQQMSDDEFVGINNHYREIHTDLRDAYTWYAAALNILTALGLGMVLYGGGQGVLAQWASLGMLIAFIQYQQRSFDPILNLTDQYSQIQTALAAGERIARMLNTEPTLKEPAQPVSIPGFRGEIRFEHVHFSYDPGVPVLRDVDIQIPARQRVAIVGATGAGKTSLAGLLARFYDVQEGAVKLDGVDVRQLSKRDLRRYVAVVPQNPYCFNGTIADNLRLFDSTISTEQMVAAARVACCAPFIEALPGTYDFELLPGGGNLSQGQRQLLALARALIHCPHGIIVLDEATSSIDTETERLIQEGLSHVLENRTSVIIAHRLSTVRDADRILVMKRGQVIEDGTHDQLLNLNGVYAQLYHRQFVEVGADESLDDVDRAAR